MLLLRIDVESHKVIEKQIPFCLIRVLYRRFGLISLPIIEIKRVVTS